jgi:hypothetical protein
VKVQRKRRGRNILNSRKKNGGEGGQGGGTHDKEWSLAAQPVLVVMNAWNGEYEVSQPIGQAQKVWLVGGGGGWNHKVTSG